MNPRPAQNDTQTMKSVGATSAVASKYLSRQDSKVLALIGPGERARSQLTAHAVVRELARVKAYSPTRENRERFAREMSAETGIEVVGIDLSRPERVYQVTHVDLPLEFPPLQSLDTRRHNLPMSITSFVGREQELADVRRHLDSARLLTLAGTGGAGKTRMALQVAAAVVGQCDVIEQRDPFAIR